MTDKIILQELAKEKIAIANSEKNLNSIKKWKLTNDLKNSKTPIFIKELPWHEFSDEFLKCKCEHPFYRFIENGIRQEIYINKHFITDNTIEPFIRCPLAYGDTDIGISESVDIVKTSETNDVVSRHFNVLIKDEDDINKIKDPDIYLIPTENEIRMNMLEDVFGGICETHLTGSQGLWFTPWDNLVRLVGVEELYYDLIDRPEFIHSLLRRFLDSYLIKMKKYVELGIWASNNTGISIGSGGEGYCDELEAIKKENYNIKTNQIWGCGNAQIFSDVSSDMHKEFSLDYEIEWMQHFGLNYYGCCEPLHNKINILENIPNLRKISMSPWANLKIASEKIGKKFVMSCKPNPAIFAGTFDEDNVKKIMKEMINDTKDNIIEIVMKDISTMNYCSENITNWSKITNDILND